MNSSPVALPPASQRTPADDARLVGSDRVLAVLKALADYPEGVSLEELTRVIGSPKPTVHRALSSLRRAGLADQVAPGRYLLGDELLRMAFVHHEARPEHLRIAPVLEALAERFGETAHYGVLDGRDIVYRAKVDPPTGAVRLTSTIGGRNPAHCTGIGKLLLSYRLHSLDDVTAWAQGQPLVRRTESSRATPESIYEDLVTIRERRPLHAVEREENEVGVACLALPVYFHSATQPSGAVSISVLTYRTPLERVLDDLDDLCALLGPLGQPVQT